MHLVHTIKFARNNKKMQRNMKIIVKFKPMKKNNTDEIPDRTLERHMVNEN